MLFRVCSVLVLAGLVACAAEPSSSDLAAEASDVTGLSGAIGRRIHRAASTKQDWQRSPGGLRFGEIPVGLILVSNSSGNTAFTSSGYSVRRELHGLSFAIDRRPARGWETGALLEGRADRDFDLEFRCSTTTRVVLPVRLGRPASEVATELAQRVEGTGCRIRTEATAHEAVWMEGLVTVTPDVGVALVPLVNPPAKVTLEGGNRLVYEKIAGWTGPIITHWPLRIGEREDEFLGLTSADVNDNLTYTALALNNRNSGLLTVTAGGSALPEGGPRPTLALFRPLSLDETRR